ncbi:MAG: glycoside hydrolase domain-containing protein [Phycisphaeraceae bacterium]
MTADATSLAEQWDALLAAVLQGDVLFVHGWYNSPSNELTQAMYQAAERIRESEPAAAEAAAVELLSQLDGAEPAGRYRAARSLRTLAESGELTPGQAEAMERAMLAVVEHEADWLVRQEAVLALGALGSEAAIDPLMSLLEDPRDTMGFFIVPTLAEIGPASLDRLATLYIEGGGVPQARALATIIRIDETRDFEKKDHTEFEWWQTDRGNWETLPKPWTAVEWDASASTIGVLDRTYHLGPLGLPAQVTSRGEDVLASPVRLELTTADGETARSDQQSTGDWQTRTKKDFRVVASTGSGLGELQLSSTITAEYDGMVKYELTLDPTQPVDVESLRLVLPYRSDLARLYHAAGRGIRFGFDFDFLPGHGNVEDTRGVFWGSKKVDGQGMAVGSFIPYMWLGGTHAGIAWFADSDEGWTPSDETSAIQMSKSDAGSVDLVLNLISEPTTLDAPRTIVFALQATPVKPMPPSWRDEEWSTGSTFKDFQQVRPKGGHLIWTNIPFTLDPDASRDMVQQNRQANSNLFAGRTPVDRLYAVPYLEWKHISPRFAPEVGYFADQWKTEIGEGLWFSPSLRDYLVYQLSNWIDEADIDGIYLDNVRPTIGDNLLAGQGYELPDGRVQPTFQMFETRELFLRFRALFHEKGKHGKFVLHMTNNFIAPWIGPADILLDGEHHSVFADSGATFMDYWSLPRIQLANPQRWGNITTFLQLHKGRWDPATLQKANRAFVGMLGSHDILVGANSNGSFAPYFWATWAFATQDEGVDFIPYWDVNDPIAGDDGDTTLASAWTHPDGRVLVIVANRGEEPTTVDLQLDAEALGLSSQAAAEVRDAELLVPESVHGRGRPSEEAQLYLAGLEPIEAAGPGRVSVLVAGEDYRLLWFGPVPEDAFDVGGGD